jgi:hypothetical protein
MIDISRRYELRSDGEVVSEVVVRLFDCMPEGRDWKVSFSVTGLGPHDDRTKAIYGIDALHAVVCALGVVRAILESSQAYKAGDLTFLGGRELSLAL